MEMWEMEVHAHTFLCQESEVFDWNWRQNGSRLDQAVAMLCRERNNTSVQSL